MTTGAHERIWTFLTDEPLRREQIETSGLLVARDALQSGLRTYVTRDGREVDDDPRLCWLALRAGRLGRESPATGFPALQHAETGRLDDPGRLERAVSELRYLSTKNLFGALLSLLWIETDRRARQEPARRRVEGLIFLCRTMQSRLPITLDWTRQASPNFVVWLGVRMLDLLPPSAVERELIGRLYFERLFTQLRGKNAPEDALVSWVSALCRYGDSIRAAAHALRLVTEDQPPAGWADSEAARIAARSAGKQGHFDIAFSLCDACDSAELDDVRLFLGILQARRSDLAGARLQVPAFRSSVASSSLLREIGCMHATRGEPEDAEVCFSQALQNLASPSMGVEASDSSAISERAIVATDILDDAMRTGLAYDRLWRAFLDSLTKLEHSHTRSKIFKVLALSLVQNGRTREGLHVIDLMYRDIGPWWCEALCEAAELLVDRGEPDEARRVLRKASASGLKWKEEQARAALGRASVKCGLTDAAVDSFERAIYSLGSYAGGARRKSDYNQAESFNVVLSRLGSTEPFAGKGRLLSSIVAEIRDIDNPYWQGLVLPTAVQILTSCNVSDSLIGDLLDCTSDSASELSAERVAAIVGTLARSGHLRACRHLVSQLSNHDPEAKLVLAEELEAAGMRVEALEAYRDFASTGHLSKAVAAMLQAGQLSEARKLSAQISTPNVRRLATSDVAVEVARLVDPTQARRLFQQEMLHPRDDGTLPFPQLALIACELPEPRQSATLLRKALHRIKAIHEPEHAKRALEAIRPSFARFRKSSVPADLLDLLAQTTIQAGGPLQGAIELAIRLGELPKAQSVAETITSPFPRCVAWAHLGGAWAREGDFEAAVHCFEVSLSAAGQYSPKGRPTESVIAEQLLAAGGFPQRVGLMNRVISSASGRQWDRDKVEALLSVVKLLADAGAAEDMPELLDQVLTKLESIGLPQELEEARVAVAAARARAGNPSWGLELRRRISSRDWTSPRILHATILAEFESNGAETALARLSDLDVGKTKADAIAELAPLVGQLEDHRQREAHFLQLVAEVAAIKDADSRAAAAGALARVIAESGCLPVLGEKLAAVVERTETMGNHDSVDWQLSGLPAMVEALAWLGRLRQALVLIQRQTEAVRDDLWWSLCRHLALCPLNPAEVEAALPTIEESVRNLKSERFRAEAQADLALALATRLGRTGDAIAGFRAAIDSAGSIDPAFERGFIFTKILERIREAGNGFDKTLLRLADAACLLDRSRERQSLLKGIADQAARWRVFINLIDILERHQLTESTWRAIMFSWRESLTEAPTLRASELRASLSIRPFDAEISLQGVHSLLAILVKYRHFDRFNAILGQCGSFASELPYEAIHAPGSGLLFRQKERGAAGDHEDRSSGHGRQSPI